MVTCKQLQVLMRVMCMIGLFSTNAFVYAKDFHKVICAQDNMRIQIGIPVLSGITKIYLEGLEGYPNEHCMPKINDSMAEFRLSLSDFYECGVTRMINKLTGKKKYYHKVVIEMSDSKEIINVRCTTENSANDFKNNGTSIPSALPGMQPQRHDVKRRDLLPAGFQEQEDLEITTNLTEHAPEPRLSIGVNQNGRKVEGNLTVTPGTPLTMEISIDHDSAPIYGLGVNYLEVTDTRYLSETIIFKGCTVDPYLFENFNTLDGDTLNAKFKAFKFPDSSYVQFRATVNVCLDKCLGTQCSNGQIGYGRRKRDIKQMAEDQLIDSNKVYEISLAMFIRINDDENKKYNERIPNPELFQIGKVLQDPKLANQRLARNSKYDFNEQYQTNKNVSTTLPAFSIGQNEGNASKNTASKSGVAVKNLLIFLIASNFCSVL